MLLAAVAAFVLAGAPASTMSTTVKAGLQEYQDLLTRYIRRVQPAGAPLDTRLDYEQIYVDDKIWTLHRSARLERIHDALLSATPSTMAPAERTAWAVNTYNFLVIERITAHLLVPGVGFTRYSRVDDIVMPAGTFFTYEVGKVEGSAYNLDTFKRRFVRGDTLAATAERPPLSDPRILFAINEGRIGSPLIMPRAYRADSLDLQLDRAVRATLALSRFDSLDTARRMLLVSDYLGRNLRDFGGMPGLLKFLGKYAPRRMREGMAAAKVTSVSRFTRVDGALDQVPHAKVIVQPSGPGKKS